MTTSLAVLFLIFHSLAYNSINFSSKLNQTI
ncbi:hypothetical protein JOD01_001184 [Brevibacillus fulvus]|uniref:Uncharacterized protein n=1 Tax=Brevibacillus fulvus TaxID=1125967 RepID=A0A938XWU1_9BACL|nr:hypothetical protein [Brevibacillus fulvus]